jgi:cation diffusion facilitator family transporter
MFSSRKGAAVLALLVVVGLIIVKGVVAALTGSLSITAQAADSFLDLFGISISFFAVRAAVAPADEGHPFGHGKLEGIGAVAQAVLILAAAGFIIDSAIHRIIQGTTVDLTEAGMAVMAFSIVASLLLSRHLHRVADRTGSLSLEASARNITADVLSAAGVLVALLVIRFTGLTIIDPIIALVVAVVILKAAFDVARQAVRELTDVRLPEEEQRAITSCIEGYGDRVAGYHAVRSRKAGGTRFIDLHLVMPREATVQAAHDLSDELERAISDCLPNSSITIHVEPCDSTCNVCQVLDCQDRLS